MSGDGNELQPKPGISWHETDWTKYLGGLAPALLVVGALIYSTGYLAMLSASSWLGVGPLEVNRETAIPVGIIVLVSAGTFAGLGASLARKHRSTWTVLVLAVCALLCLSLLTSSEATVEGSPSPALMLRSALVSIIPLVSGFLVIRMVDVAKAKNKDLRFMLALLPFAIPFISTLFGNAFPVACLSPGSIFGNVSRSRFVVRVEDSDRSVIAEGILIYEDSTWIVLEIIDSTSRHCEKIAKSKIARIVGSPIDSDEGDATSK